MYDVRTILVRQAHDWRFRSVRKPSSQSGTAKDYQVHLAQADSEPDMRKGVTRLESADITELYMKMKYRATGFLFTLSWSLSFALYFQQGEREEKCIIEDIPGDTLVTGRYKIQLWDFATHDFLPSAPGLGLFVNVKGPEEQILLHKLYGPESRFTFQSHSQGEHHICLMSNSTKVAVFAGNKLRIHLDIQVGEHPIDESLDEIEDKMNDVEERIQHLVEQMKYISKQQDYQRSREEEFRQTSEETNSNVLWWAIIQTIILLSMGVWQMRQMKNFLIAKKLV
ncbi:transmembrane emp24 domain-containing protein 11-like [Heptranchias perlo]|uniref:transmembrane emp24 domain-containing protein 11-like n=1 Tax=Heptranchias perlo TaxID=212740 RepID=UPI00355A3FF1